jgi:hypothetical protein
MSCRISLKVMAVRKDFRVSRKTSSLKYIRCIPLRVAMVAHRKVAGVVFLSSGAASRCFVKFVS